MNPINSSDTNWRSEGNVVSKLDNSDLSMKIVALMQKQHVEKNEIKTFLRENRKELAAFAFKTPVHWMLFSNCMKQQVENFPSKFTSKSIKSLNNYAKKKNIDSKLHKLFRGLDHKISNGKIHLSEVFSKEIRLHIACQYRGNLNHNIETIRKILLEDNRYIVPSPKVLGLLPEDLASVIDHQKIPLDSLDVKPEELALILSKLKVIDLSGRSKEDISSVLSQLKDVSHLNLSNSEISPEVLNDLIKLKNLKALNLSFCEIGDRELKAIKKLSKLEILNLSYCKNFTNSGLAYVGVYKNLKNLDLSYTNCNDKGIMCLMSLKGLSTLNLAGNREISSTALKLLKFLPLISLNLKGCINCTDDVVEHLQNLKETLKVLDLSECYLISDKGVGFLGAFYSLIYLNLKGCGQLTDEGVSQLLDIPNLKYLNLHATGTSEDVRKNFVKNIKG